jgi:hypothetical protein
MSKRVLKFETSVWMEEEENRTVKKLIEMKLHNSLLGVASGPRHPA